MKLTRYAKDHVVRVLPFNGIRVNNKDKKIEFLVDAQVVAFSDLSKLEATDRLTLTCVQGTVDAALLMLNDEDVKIVLSKEQEQLNGRTD